MIAITRNSKSSIGRSNHGALRLRALSPETAAGHGGFRVFDHLRRLGEEGRQSSKGRPRRRRGTAARVVAAGWW